MSKRVLLAGAGTAARMAVEQVREHPEAGLEPIGFLDDDPSLRDTEILGLPVLGGLDALVQTVRQHRVDDVLIAIPTAHGSVIRRLVSACGQAQVASRIVPGIMEIIRGDVHFEHIRPVRPEDLLVREVVELDDAAIAASLLGKRVMVTGAGGSIGQELCRRIAPFQPHEVVLLGRGENSVFEIDNELRDTYPGLRVEPQITDIRDADAVRRVVGARQPDVIFHAAAHKHVHYMERFPCEAVLNNVWGTLQVLRAAQEAGSERFVFISTDKAVRPSSVMGASKRFTEHVLQAIHAAGSTTCIIAVRFGNVLASRGSVVTLFQAQLRRGVPLTVTHPEATRFFMTVREACLLVLQAASLGRGGEVFTLNMGEAVHIGELARDLVALSGFDPDRVEIRYTGLRPGEKLHEELHADTDSALPSPHPQLLVAKLGALRVDDALAAAADLTAHAQRGDGAAVRATLAAALGDYEPVDGF
jgi:FlaA1/EpsC-like NDP-sugar epimerase